MRYLELCLQFYHDATLQLWHDLVARQMEIVILQLRSDSC